MGSITDWSRFEWDHGDLAGDCEACPNTAADTVVGYIHGAWSALHQLGHHSAYDDVARTAATFSDELRDLFGRKDQVWQRLADLHVSHADSNPTLF
jgi:hypothetical protein